MLRSEPPPSDEQKIKKMQHLDLSVSPVESPAWRDDCSKEESITLIPTMNTVCPGRRERGASTMTRPSEASQGTQEQKAPIVTLPILEPYICYSDGSEDKCSEPLTADGDACNWRGIWRALWLMQFPQS